ncbi:ribokinase, partial [Mesorhizobium sp. M7A.F.Ca.CA.002.05.1.1]
AKAAAAISVPRHGGSSAPTNREIQTFLSHAADPSGAGRTQKANA